MVTEEENTMNCTIDGCTRPRYHHRTMCNQHYMRLYRYGDPHYQPTYTHTDLTGRRFGTLVAVERVGHRWRCVCDCGRERMALVGDLNRHGDQCTCGNRQAHYRVEVPRYGPAHDRIRYLRGPASAHPCVDCGDPAAHWSYDNGDPNEHIDYRDGRPLRYSTKPEHYAPRCVSCHKKFDLAA